MNIEELSSKYPVVRALRTGKETAWINERTAPAAEALARLPLTRADVDDAEARLARFAPYFLKAFPETADYGGLIESPLTEIPGMRAWLNEQESAGISGRLFLKRDSDLAVAGSVKARGGIYEVLHHAEALALEAGLLRESDDYRAFASPQLRDFFAQHAIHVGSTGNLGLSIGTMSAALGFRVFVHMSADAKQWKKDLLRSRGVTVIEYAADYSRAVAEGRALAQSDPMSYFVDDENSQTLFLGYAVAARRLKAQLAAQGVTVDAAHPLLVSIPCGVGGAPGGVCFGLKQEFGDNVFVFFDEPTQAPCMLLGLATGLHDAICVQDIGLTGKTAADGLAVGRPSRFVGRTVQELVSGAFTVEDAHLFPYMRALLERDGLFIEPSSCAAFIALSRLSAQRDFLASAGLDGAALGNATCIAWATGGRLVPQAEREKYCAMYQN